MREPKPTEKGRRVLLGILQGLGCEFRAYKGLKLRVLGLGWGAGHFWGFRVLGGRGGLGVGRLGFVGFWGFGLP